MKELISLDQMFNNIKSKNEKSKLSIEAFEKTIAIINKIVKARESLGLTQRELAKRCGIQQPALARIESFKVIPQINTLIKIAQVVDVNIEALTSVEKQQNQKNNIIRQVVINVSINYSNNTSINYTNNGGYSWRQNSMTLR